MTSEPTDHINPGRTESLEVPVPELLQRARPLPSREAMLIDDVSEEEGLAFLAALK